MTKESADEAISRIKSMLCDGCSSYRGVLCSACKLDDGMSVIECMANPNERVVTWHPFPQEKPTQSGYYLVTLNMFGKIFVHVHPSNGTFDVPVIAWAELPEPYKETI